MRYLVGLPEVELNHQDSEDKDTALHLAVCAVQTDVVQVLIDAGADIDTRGDDGRSPLHTAYNSETPDVVKMLVEAGAGVRATDNDGYTCLMFTM